MIGRSAIGVQISSDRPTGFGRWLDACAATDAPVAVVFSVDREKASETKLRSSRTVTFFRSQKSTMGADNPQDIINTPDVEDAAEEWMTSLLPQYLANAGFNYAVFNNEWDITDLEAGRRINRFQLRCMEIIDRWSLGFKAGALSFSTGCPSDDPIADGSPLTMEQRLETILPAVKYACEHVHVLVFHAHACGISNTGEDVALRLHRILRYFADAAAHPEFGSLRPVCAIGEFSNGCEGIEPNIAEWLAAVKWMDEQLRQSPWRDQIIGFALYGYTAAATIAPAVDDLIAWMTHLPELPVITPPVTETVRTYDRTVHLLPPGVSMPEAGETPDPAFLAIVHFAAAGRESIVASADDAFINPPQCVSRTVYVYNVGEWGGQDYFERWIEQWYPPLPTIVYREV